MVVPKSVECFELTDDATAIPDWVKDCLDHQDDMTDVTPENSMPLLVDELVRAKIFSSKSEARNLIKNHGLSMFCFEAEGEPYRAIDGTVLDSFSDKKAVIDNPNIHWTLEDGDVIKTGKRKYFIIRIKEN
jgi:tyrosyl-tRNA synthetase